MNPITKNNSNIITATVIHNPTRNGVALYVFFYVNEQV